MRRLLYALAVVASLLAALPAAAQDCRPGWRLPSWRDCWPFTACNAEAFTRPHCLGRFACPDDYCPRPYPRVCWPPYPDYYTCVPYGEHCHRAPHTQGAPPPPGSARLLDIILGRAP